MQDERGQVYWRTIYLSSFFYHHAKNSFQTFARDYKNYLGFPLPTLNSHPLQSQMSQAKTITIASIGPVLLERSAKARRMNISVRPFKGVRVAVPKGVPFTVAEQFARSRTDWLRHHLPRMRTLEKLYRAASLTPVAIDIDVAGKVLATRLKEIAEKHGYRYNRVTIRNQKTRWGSCSSTNNISLNAKLTLLPDELRDFILLHELVHTRVKNHGPKFWAELVQAEPRAGELAKKVNTLSIGLL
jgi:predicted metal-dependent hydrolase